MTFANTPGHVLRLAHDLYALVECQLMNFVDVFYPNRKPHALVQTIVSLGFERRGIGAFAPAPLTIETQENFALPGTDTAEINGFSPFPVRRPAEVFEPGKRRIHVGNVEYRSDVSNVHRGVFLRDEIPIILLRER